MIFTFISPVVSTPFHQGDPKLHVLCLFDKVFYFCEIRLGVAFNEFLHAFEEGGVALTGTAMFACGTHTVVDFASAIQSIDASLREIPTHVYVFIAI